MYIIKIVLAKIYTQASVFRKVFARYVILFDRVFREQGLCTVHLGVFISLPGGKIKFQAPLNQS